MTTEKSVILKSITPANNSPPNMEVKICKFHKRKIKNKKRSFFEKRPFRLNN